MAPIRRSPVGYLELYPRTLCALGAIVLAAVVLGFWLRGWQLGPGGGGADAAAVASIAGPEDLEVKRRTKKPPKPPKPPKEPSPAPDPAAPRKDYHPLVGEQALVPCGPGDVFDEGCR